MNASLVNAALVRLALRRALPPGLLVCALALAAIAGTARWSPPAGLLGEPLGQPDADGIARALTRQGVWTALSLALLPYLVARAAATVPGWRRGEVDWLASSQAGRGSVLVSTWVGTAAGGALLLAGVALAAELAAGAGGEEALRVERVVPAPHVVLVEDDRPAVWRLDGDAHGSLRVRLLLVGGPSADVRLVLERGGKRSEVERRVSSRTELRAPLPPGSGPVDVALERVGPGAIVALDPPVELLVPAASERAGSVALWCRASLSLAVWLALALGLGAWVSGPIAAAAVLAVTLFAWSRGALSLPWSGLPAAIELVGLRLVPPALSPLALVTAVVLAASSLALGAAGLRTWRRVQ